MPPPPTPAPDRSTGLLVIAHPIADDAAVRALCERLCAVITTSDAGTIVVDVSALPASCRSIEALARLQLTAHRVQRRIHLHGASPELEQLLDFAGLADIVPTSSPLVGRPSPQRVSSARRTAGTAGPHQGSS